MLHFIWYGRFKWLQERTASEAEAPIKKTPRPESASELYRPSVRRLSAKGVPTFEDRGVPRGVTDPHGRILGFLDREAPINPLLLKKTLRGLSPRAKYTERPPLVGEVSANFYG
jgi:hypothetical protein